MHAPRLTTADGTETRRDAARRAVRDLEAGYSALAEALIAFYENQAGRSRGGDRRVSHLKVAVGLKSAAAESMSGGR